MSNQLTINLPLRKRLIVAAISACFASAPAWSNPTNPQVVNGSASFSQNGNLLKVTNSAGAIINWNTFSIGANETTRFEQPSAASSVLNRVLANDPSVLLGTLSSNGRVWLINPAGIMVGQGARIDVGGFVASTLNVRNEDFLAGRLNFQATPNAGRIDNSGRITTPSGGSVYLIAPEVTNKGIISAPNGEVLLAAGQTVQLLDTGTPGVKVEITGNEGSATNLGEIVADAGRIGMAGVLVKNSGLLNASSVTREGGRVFLKASKDITLDAASEIKADGGNAGNGGTILALADDTTYVDGSVSARGGSQSGDGGFVETSGAHVKVADTARIASLAPNGKAGTWLIDPANYTIAASGGDITGASLGTALNAGDISILSSQGTVNTAGNGDIFVNDGISWNSPNSLTLTAVRDINVNQSIANTGLGGVNLNATGDINITSRNVSTSGPVAVTAANLNVVSSTAPALLKGASMTATISGNIIVTASAAGAARMVATSGSQTISASGIIVQGGPGGTNNFAEISSSSGNQSISVGNAGLTLNGGGGGALDTDNYALVAQIGTAATSQTITVNAGGFISMTGGSSGLSNVGSSHGSRALIQSDGGSQQITFGAGGSIFLTGGTSGSRAFAQIYASTGPQTISGYPTISLTGGASGGVAGEGNYAQIFGNAGQSITASAIHLDGGSGNSNRATLEAYGTQTIDVNGLGVHLKGGSAGSDNYAGIRQNSTTLGSQSIILRASGAVMELQGGSGNGNSSTSVPDECNLGGVNTYCRGMTTSNNQAFIRNNFGPQTIDFQQGGALSLTGGSVGLRNHAAINNSSTGVQTITSTLGNFANIVLTGGASGGGQATDTDPLLPPPAPGSGLSNAVPAVLPNSQPIYVRNDAFIKAENATVTTRQTIRGGLIGLSGAGNATTFGGAYITAPAQDIRASGDLLLLGGAGDSSGGSPTTAAVITNPNGSTDVQLTVGGKLTLAGGTGRGSGALIGSRYDQITNVTADVAGEILAIAGSSSFGAIGAGIGSYAGNGGAVTLRAGQNISFSNGTLITQAAGTPVAPMNVTLLAKGDIELSQFAVKPLGGAVTLMAGWNGNITSPALATAAPGGSASGSVSMSGASIQGTGSINVKAYGALLLDSISGATIFGEAGGSLILNSGASLSASGTGNSLVLVANTNFHNVSGSTALSASAGRWTVYSADPALDTRGGLGYNFKQYGMSYGGAPYSGSGSGNGFIYSVAPTVSLSLTGATSKVYDGTTTATLSGSNFTTTGALDGDTIVLDNPTSGTYADKNAGNGKSVSTTVSFLGAYDGAPAVKAYGYQIANSFAPPPDPGTTVVPSPVATASGNIGQITPAPLTVSAAGQNKAYDAGTAATASLSDNRLTGDVLTLAYGSAAFNNKNVGTAKPVTVTGITLSGADAGNYAPNTTANTTASITVASLTVSATGQNKTYDATTAATVSLSDNRLTGDVLTLAYSSAAFNNKNVGTAKPVTASGISLSGADAGNYSFNTTAATTANITPASLTVGVAGQNKVYDATTAATVSVSDTRLSGDVLAITYANAAFSDKNVGTAKPVAVTGINLGGADAGNYTFNTAASTSANITPAALSVSGISASGKVYDGNSAATLSTGSATLVGVFSGDSVALSGGSGSFSDKNVGTAKPVAVTGLVIGGAQSGNYVLSAPTGLSASITQRPLSTWASSTSGLWSNPVNWDAIPDGSNVLAVSIPAGVGSYQVTYDASAGNTSLQSLNSAQTLALSGGSLTISGNLSTAGLVQSGGTLGGGGNLTVSNSFSQSGGSIALTGSASAAITQTTGDLVIRALSAPTVSLTAQAGGISQSGPIVAPVLVTKSVTGTNLNDAGNQVSSFSATNSGSGNIVLTNKGALSIASIANSGGNVTLDNTGVVTASGGLSASGDASITADTLMASNFVVSATKDARVQVTGDLRMNDGSSLTAGNDIWLTLKGVSSTFYLNDQAGLRPSYLWAKSPSTINIDYTTRTSGGFVANGAATDLTSYSSAAGGSGFFAGATQVPAAPGAGLKVAGINNAPVTSTTTAAAIVTVTNTAIVSTTSATTNAATSTSTTTAAKVEAPPPPQVTTPGSTGTLLLANTNQTVGGTEGTFGSSSSATVATSSSSAPASSSSAAPSGQGDKPAVDKPAADKPAEDKSASAKKDEKKDDKKDDEKKKKEEEAPAKKEDKPAAKKIATCS